jgi:hypothetical protein
VWIPNGSRVIQPGCVTVFSPPVTLLTRTATCPGSIDVNDPSITARIANAAPPYHTQSSHAAAGP